jgi:hypothetical protein
MNAIPGNALASPPKSAPSAAPPGPLLAGLVVATGTRAPEEAVFGEILGESLQAMTSLPLPDASGASGASDAAVPAPVVSGVAALELPPVPLPAGPQPAVPQPAGLAPRLGDALPELPLDDERQVDSDASDSPSAPTILAGFGFPFVQLPPAPAPAPDKALPSPSIAAVGDAPAPRPVAAEPLGAVVQPAPTADVSVTSAVPSPATAPEPGYAAETAVPRRSSLPPAPGGEDKVATRSGAETPDLPTPSAVPAAADGPRTLASEPVLKLANGQSAQWQQPLTDALGERLSLLRESGRDSAVIRLDPPAMGQIEITIRHEAGTLKVSLEATHSEVLRQLQGIGEALRQDLAQKQGGEVTVQVAQAPTSYLSQRDSEGGERQRRQQQQSLPGQALAEADTDREAKAFRLPGSGE